MLNPSPSICSHHIMLFLLSLVRRIAKKKNKHRKQQMLNSWPFRRIQAVRLFFFSRTYTYTYTLYNLSEGTNSLSLKILKNGKERELCGTDTYVHMLQRFRHREKNETACVTNTYYLLCMNLFRYIKRLVIGGEWQQLNAARIQNFQSIWLVFFCLSFFQFYVNRFSSI